MLKKILLCIFFLSLTTFFLRPQKSQITVVGPLIVADGLGKNTIDFVNILSEKFKVNCFATSKVLDEIPHEFCKKILRKSKNFGQVILYTQPVVASVTPRDVTVLERARSQVDSVMVAYSMFESSMLPKEGVDRLNKYFDLVVVPDKYLVDVYKNSGVTKPIYVLPLALDISDLLESPLKNQKKDPFVFTVLSSSIYRKNILGVVEAFSELFGNNPKFRLRVNSRYSTNGSNHEILRFLDRNKVSNVEFTTKALSSDAYRAALKNSDCVLNVTFGEGFSILPREAMSLGIPVIVTNNTAQKSICQTKLVKAVDCPISEPAYHYFLDTPAGSFFKCTKEDLKNAMLDVYQNYDKYLENGQMARDWAKSFDKNEMKIRYIHFFDPENIHNLAYQKQSNL